MTLIIALACKDGAILASDGQATTLSTGGPIRQTISKIKWIGENTLWSAAGSIGFIQKIEKELEKLPVETQKAELEQLCGSVIQIIHRIRVDSLDRHRSLYGPGRDGEAPSADLLFVEYKSGNPKILHINPDCIDEWLEEFGFGACGIGDTFAYTLLKNYDIKNLSVDGGKVVAYRVISDAIALGAFGLGEPIEIRQVTGEGEVAPIPPEEMSGIRDTVRVWREVEAETFGKLLSPRGDKPRTPRETLR